MAELARERDLAAMMSVVTRDETHRSEFFSHQSLAADPNLDFPIDRLRELVSRGRGGDSNRRHLWFMGSIAASGRLLRDSPNQPSRRSGTFRWMDLSKRIR